MGKKNVLHRQDTPPSVKALIGIKKVAAAERFTCLVVSTEIHGYWTHWDGQRTVPCLNGPKLCPYHLKLIPARWAGFVHVANPDGTGNNFLELTALAAQTLLDVCRGRQSMRGAIIHVNRKNGKLRSPLEFALVGEFDLNKPFRAPADPLPTLKRIWRMPDDC